jgi:hypothetical protein
MELEQIIRERKSITGYLEKPVPRATIDEIIEVAKWTPSSRNTQPWYIHVVTSAPLDRIRKGNTENMMKGIPPRCAVTCHRAGCLGARGLGCVINGQGIMQSSVVREHTGIPNDPNIMICIATSYPDESFVANWAKSVREDNTTFVCNVGFDETHETTNPSHSLSMDQTS